jgi:hypothetical protein
VPLPKRIHERAVDDGARKSTFRAWSSRDRTPRPYPLRPNDRPSRTAVYVVRARRGRKGFALTLISIESSESGCTCSSQQV